MIRTIRSPMVMALVALTAVPGLARSQQPSARFGVLVPDFFAWEGADRDFGKDVAKELRTLLNTLLTHRAVDRDAVEDALDAVDKDMKDLECVTTRQLALMIGAEVALCASYQEESDGRFAVTAVFWDVRSSESFTVDPAVGADGHEEEVAQEIFRHFDRYTAHLRAAGNCETYAQSQLWDQALGNCDDALELNPEAIGTRYRRARILFETDRGGEALEELERVLEADPFHEAGLQLAGYVSATLGESERAHGYYSRYLELSPGDANVRMRIAYDLAQAGDPRGAMLLIREGLDIDGENTALWQQLGGYAFSIGESIYRELPEEDRGALVPDAIRYYRDAIEAFERVFAAQGDEASVGVFRNAAVSHFRLGEFGEAAAWAEQGLEIHAGEARLWSAYADALRRMDRLDAALDALAQVQELDPEYPDVGFRRGSWLLGAGRIPEAVEALREAVTTDPGKADAAARLVWVDAHANGVQQDRYDYAIDAISAVRELPGLSEPMQHQLNFWLGYSVLRDAATEQEPRTLESARATLPRFQRALSLLEVVGTYPSRVKVDIEQLRSNVRQYVEIQEAIIRRGG